MNISRMALAVSLLISGCAIMGRQQVDHPIDAEKVARIHKGMSRDQVTEVLGAPQEIIFSNKEHDPLREHAYVYQHTRSKYTGIVFGFINFGNVDEKKDRVLVFFDEEGNVNGLGASLYSDESSYGFPFGK
ncbi:MAG: outer membrane protein assembly factor BamE [Planctomycetes bacterium]|nr:outer membrane protein assembly factor BamE [Planctomycetota bacterium]